MKNSALARVLVSTISLTGCVASMDATIAKGNESDVPTDGKFDGASLALQRPLYWFDSDPRGRMQGFDDGELTSAIGATLGDSHSSTTQPWISRSVRSSPTAKRSTR